ncbi:MAG: universal stress protein [Rhizobacter sp.]|nr:universal stress protein [Rhizobacter sp.]
MYQRILVPVDGSVTSMRGLDEAIRLAQLTKGRLRLLHVIDELSLALGTGYGMTYTGDIAGLLREAGADILEEAMARVRQSDVQADTVLNDSFGGQVRDLVVSEIVSWKAELVVLGTHGRRGVDRLFMGSDAECIVRLSTVPVLLVRAIEKAGVKA